MDRKAKAVVCREWGQPVQVETITVEGPRRDEITIRIGACGVCHSDQSATTGKIPYPAPLVLGHEAAGVVIEVGEGVTAFKEGDHVVSSFISMCGKCRQCVRGRPVLCENARKAMFTLPDGTVRTKGADGEDLNVFGACGVMAEYATMHVDNCVKVDESVPMQNAALVGCAVMTGAGAVYHTAGVKEGDSVAIFGVGGVGLSAVVAAKVIGADPIIAVDLDDEKLEFAKHHGATIGVNASNGDAVDQIRALTMTEGEFDMLGRPLSGVDYAFDCIGHKVTMEQIVPAARPGAFGRSSGGVAVLVGVPLTSVELDARDILVNEKKFIGSIGGSCRPDRDFPMFLRWYKEGDLDLEALVTQRYELDQINEACDALTQGQIAGRSIMEFAQP